MCTSIIIIAIIIILLWILEDVLCTWILVKRHLMLILEFLVFQLWIVNYDGKKGGGPGQDS